MIGARREGDINLDFMWHGGRKATLLDPSK